MKNEINFKRRIKILLFISVLALSFVPFVVGGVLSSTEVNRFSEINFSNIKTANSIDPPAGLVSWWPGDQNPFDIAGTNHIHMKNDTTFVLGKVGEAFHFDGDGDYMEVPDDPSLKPGTSSFSIDFWLKTTYGGYQTFLIKGSTQQGFGGVYQIEMSENGLIRYVLGDGEGHNILVEGINEELSVNDGEWHLITLTVGGYPNWVSTLYVDGVKDFSRLLTGLGSIDPIGPLYFGRLLPGIWQMRGELDEIEFFNRKLTEFEIQAIYNAGEQGKNKPDKEIIVPNPVLINTDITLTHDLCCQGDGLIVTKDGITIDGEEGFKLIGPGYGFGINLNGHSGVTIRDFHIEKFDYGIWVENVAGNTIKINYMTKMNFDAISLISASGTTVTNNIYEKNSRGIYMDSDSTSNEVYLNLFMKNGVQMLDEGINNFWWSPELGLGNFWSNYWGEDLDGDGLGDTNLPHMGVDEAPLTDPSIPYQFDLLPFGGDWWQSLTWVMVWRGGWSPVDIQASDPLGRIISRDENQIGYDAFYVEDTEWEPGVTKVMVIIATSPLETSLWGDYSFQMEALEDLDYSMEWFAFQQGNILFERSVENVPMSAKQIKNVVINLEEDPSGEIIVSPTPQYNFGGILQPINPDGSSVFKQKSTIPVKFQLFNDLDLPIGTAHATIEVVKISDGVSGDFEEPVSTSAADNGNIFRYDVLEQQYIFNLGTKQLEVGTYTIKISLDDGQIFTVQISLR
ncbi:MAG: LamG-like jellyroll fold domain-containing protein [Candidatus Hodarchaeota archaeon]